MVKNKLKSVIISLGLIVMFVFSGVSVVFGVGVSGGAEGNGSEFKGGDIGSCGGNNCIWAGHVGVRFSLVDANGNKVSGTNHIDLWALSKINDSLKVYYDLYDDGGTRLWNFAGARYGDQIKQEVFSSEEDLKSGDYFKNANIYDVQEKLSGFTFDYNRWDDGFAHKIAEYIRINTSNEDMSVMNSILKLMGYTVGENFAVSASNAGYFIQYEPLILHGRIGKEIKNYIFIGTPTEYYKYEYDVNVAGKLSPWFNEGTTGVYIYRAGVGEAPSNFTTGEGNCVGNLLTKDSNGKIIGEGVAHIWIRDLIDTEFSCNDAIDYINSKYTPGTSAYHTAVSKLRNGTFEYKDATGVKRVQTEGYNYQYLKEDVYTNLPGGLAACNDPAADSCQRAIDYINNNPAKYPKGSDAYHKAVAQVKDKTFTYVIGVNAFTIDSSENTNYDYLNRGIYETSGGVAACKNKGVCDYSGFNVFIDDCVSGKTSFGDITTKDAWLSCEMAYTKDGIIYSSDNTGHVAVEDENGGIVGNAEYCELFCYEEFETSFPTNVYGVKAGQTFTWGTVDGTFGSVKVKKVCSTQSYVKGQHGYRFEEWKEDYNKNEKELIKYYMNKAAYEEAMNNIKYEVVSEINGCPECESCDGFGCSCQYTCEQYKVVAKTQIKSQSYQHSGYIGTVKTSSSIVGDDVSASSDWFPTESAAKKDAKDKLKAKLQELADAEYANYTGKISQESTLLQKIRQCTNNLKYVNKTNVRFTFSEPVNDVYGSNSRNFTFDANLDVIEDYNQDNVDTSSCTEKKVYSYECTGTGESATCSPKAQTVLDCSVVTWNVEGTYTYTYPIDKFTWFSLKTDSTLVNKDNKGSEDEAFFYSIGFGIPTALSLSDGFYGLQVTVSNIGDSAETKGNQQYNVDNGHFAPIANPVNTLTGDGYGFDYSCVYEVENEVFGNECEYDDEGNLTEDSPAYCDEDKDDTPEGSLVGIDITYRMVTLLNDGDSIDKAFPGIDGEGREPASNWASIGESRIKEILSVDVYDTDQAMYEIMLDVNAIQQIRKDNETYFDAGKDPYTSYVDADNAQKVYCVTGDDQQKYCASDFISSLYTGTGLNYRLLGTCLPTSNTLERAEYILEKGCDTSYTYPTINWAR